MSGKDDTGIHHGPMMQAEQDPAKNDYATPPELWRPLANAVDGYQPTNAEVSRLLMEQYDDHSSRFGGKRS